MTSTTVDRYPSRTGTAWTLQERPDPVVWADPGSIAGPLTSEQLEQFDRDGYLFLDSVFSPDEVEAYREELVRMSNDPAIRQKPITVLESDDAEVRSIFEVHKHSTVFRRLMQEPRVADAARQILGSDVYIHQSRVNLKPALYGKGFFWHSDFETWHVEDGMPRPRAVSASIALTENNEFNGPLMVIPGSHKTYVSCAGATPEDHYKESLRKQENGVPDEASLRALVERSTGIVAPKGPAGSVILFECNMMHGSVENISPYPRSNVFFVFNSLENTLEEPFGAPRPRPEFIATREFTPVDQL